MNRSSAEIERDVEETRRHVESTAEALKDKMYPGQIMGELMKSFKGGGGSEMIGNLGSLVKKNPLPLAMIVAGFAWLMMGSGKDKSEGGACESASKTGPPS